MKRRKERRKHGRKRRLKADEIMRRGKQTRTRRRKRKENKGGERR